MFVPRFTIQGDRKGRPYPVPRWLALSALLAGVLLASCSNPFGGAQSTPTTSQSPDASLAKLSWCSKPAMLFRDEGATPTPTATASATVTTTPITTVTATPG
ncbi:MAG TPA: hypothetical protein VKR83_12480, partial [Ktedonobacteraceae bacterium]|nr:hypothetical protein [Ktedonobacteraceae bacterium]